MKKSILKFFLTSIPDIHLATYTLAGLAFLSMMMGLVRDHLLAFNFGAGESLDIYFAAFRIPDLLFASVASFMSVYALLPLFEEKELKGNLKEFVNNIFSFFSILLIFGAVIAFFLMPFIIETFFSSFSDRTSELILLSRILLIQTFLLGVSNFFVSIAQFRHKFILYGTTPILYNIGIFISIFFFIPYFTNDVLAVVLGVVLGAILHVSAFIPFIIKEKILGKLQNPFKGIMDVKKVMVTSLPRTIGISLNTVSLFFLVSLASTLTTGSISVLLLSHNLVSAPITLVGISYSVAAFPVLTKLFTKRDTVNFFDKVRNTFRHVIFWALPAAAAFLVLRAHIVRLILGSGEFDWFDTRLTAAALVFFAVIIVAQSITFLIVRASYAARNVLIPLITSIFSFIFVISLSYYLIYLHNTNEAIRTPITNFLKVSGVPGTEILMIPLAIAIVSVLQVIILITYFQIKNRVLKIDDVESIIKSATAAFAFIATTYLSLQILGLFIELNTFINVFIHGAISGIIGIISWVLSLWWLKSEVAFDTWNQIKRIRS